MNQDRLTQPFSKERLPKKLMAFLKDPHGAKIKRLKERYQELNELSNVATEIGDGAAYRSLQVEMREVFFDYLTAVAVDSIYSLVPHVLIVWIISLKWPTITLPLVSWEINTFAGYFACYIFYYLAKGVFGYLKARLTTKSILVSTESHNN
ncbi:hypothetical protein [Desulforamulus aeronauticus]|uniref:Holin of 3TMs, for gene-transfer release n=1 Tax=Desulforamulus aeronauticus DSM 10349 TaxID=1121421 RepID=A0A1M6VVS3_9FIRM|nr:hypothetical protein [Desulforamulus aeronauticus]SHK85475.1 hypothetical protein SAMN02745123_03378 [Desulforamulus aeronauticus DSM 10349]